VDEVTVKDRELSSDTVWTKAYDLPKYELNQFGIISARGSLPWHFCQFEVIRRSTLARQSNE